MSLYEFAGCELDADAHELRRNGETLELGATPLHLLFYLVRNPGRVVSRDELLEQVWKQPHRSRSTVPTAVALVRKALGDDARSPRFIEAIPGRGYRFLPAVSLRAGDVGRGPNGAVADGAAPSAAGNPLVGRESELQAIERGLESALTGHARGLLFCGEAGIGKTRLLEEARLRLDGAAVVCAMARCWEVEGAPALWPWRQLLREVARQDGGGSEEILGALSPPGDGDGAPASGHAPPPVEGERFRLFERVVRRLQAATAHAPLVLLVDDLHRADVASLRLLRFAVRELWRERFLLVGTFRDDERSASQGALPELSQLGVEECVALRTLPALAPEDVERLLHPDHAHPESTCLLAQQLHESSGGNPFLLGQLIPLVAREGRSGSGSEISAGGGPMPVPRAVRLLVREQLDGFDAATRELLELGSTLGRELSLPLLARVVGSTVEEVASRLAPAWSGRLVREVAPGAPGCAFSHALVRDAVYAELDPPTRARWHLRVGEALEALHADDPAPASAELAHHFCEAAEIGGADRAVRYSTLAARFASDQLAYETAARHYREAIRMLGLTESPSARQRGELLLALGQAEIGAGERETARSVLQEAASLARRLGDAELFAGVAMSFAPGPLAMEVGVYDPLLVGLLREALELAPEGSPSSTHLRARLALALVWADEQPYRLRVGEAALREARGHGEPRILADALLAQWRARAGPEHLEERLQMASELGDLGRSLRDPTLLLMHRILRITGLVEQGCPDTVARELASFTAETEKWGSPGIRWYVTLFRAMQALGEGRLPAAEKLAREFLQQGQEAGDQNAVQAFGAHLGTVLWLQGRAADAASLTQRFIERYPPTRAWECGQAFIRFVAGDPEGARRSFERVAGNDFEDVPPNELWTFTLVAGAFAATWLGDRKRAARLYELLLPGADQCGVAGFGVASYGSLSLPLGMLAGTLERWEDAGRHFADAIERNTRLGLMPWVAQAHVEWAATCARSGDGHQTREQAAQALAIARPLGLQTFVRKASLLSTGF